MTEQTAIKRGTVVTVVDAFGERTVRRALAGRAEEGYDFPVILVCTDEEWDAVERGGSYPTGVPWPAEDVQAADEVNA